MTKSQLKIISDLLEWKCTPPTDENIAGLKDLKNISIQESTGTVDVAAYAKQLFDVLNLKELFDSLGLEVPDFSQYEEDDDSDEEDKNVNMNEVKKISKNMFKWGNFR